MKSVMTHEFSRVPSVSVQRSSFKRSHGLKTTFDAGYLVPIFFDDALPGDTMKLDMTSFGRLATPIVPYMDNLFVDVFFFAIPERLIWDNFKRFMGEQDNPGDSTDYLTPIMTSPVGGYDVGSLSDYLSMPVGIAGYEHRSAWHRAYNLVVNEWFRDENLQDSVVVDKGDGPDDPADYVLFRRGKRHDYFTSALPFPQKGPSVVLPLGGSAPVIGDGSTIGFTDGTNDSSFFAHTNGSLSYAQSFADQTLPYSNASPSGYVGANYGGLGLTEDAATSHVFADLTSATAATINDLRRAVQVQKLFERDARGGTRYIENVFAHFGVISPDARQQRSEYLGGSSSAIHTHPVQQTSSTDATTPQGNLAAYATFTDSRAGFTKSFTEHTILLGLASVRADLNYQQGLNRMFSRRTRFDYYFPVFAHLGEQAILNKEIYLQGTSADDDVFAYQESFAEYRYKPSVITGQMRSGVTDSFDIWHAAQHFTSLPALNSTFIEDNPPLDRVLAVTEGAPQILFDAYFDYFCARPMPVYSVPGLMDHF